MKNDIGGNMETKWEYDLPTNEHSEDYQYESPIFINYDLKYSLSIPMTAYLNHSKINNPKHKKTAADCHAVNKSLHFLSSRFFANLSFWI